MFLLCTLDAKGGMLIWHDIVLIVRVDGLMLHGD